MDANVDTGIEFNSVLRVSTNKLSLIMYAILHRDYEEFLY